VWAVVDSTVVEYTQIEDDAMMKAWNITQAELTQYREYMQTTGRYYYTHLDPVMVLGISSDNPADRDRFAELYIRNEVTMRLQEQEFITSVGYAHTRLYGKGKRFDFSKVPGYAEHQRSQAQVLTANIKSNSVHVSAPGSLPSYSIADYHWEQRNALISVDLLVDAICDTCLAQFEKVLTVSPTQVIVNVFFSDKQGVPEDVLYLLQSSAAYANRPPARIVNFKRYDPLLWDEIDKVSLPVAVIRRNGIAVARGR